MTMTAEAAPAEAAPAAPSDSGQRNEPFTPEDVLKHWKAYAEKDPTARILNNAMRIAQPRREGDTSTYIVPAMNDYQQQIFEDALPAISYALRNALRNDSFALKVCVTETDMPPTAWTQPEILDHMLKEYPHFADFVKDFGLTPG